jgi:enoyl-CoA hydratase
MNDGMTGDILRLERRRAVVVLTLQRPQRLNALDNALVSALGEAFAGFEADESLRVIVITGEGRAFSAGADITELAALTGPHAFSAHVKAITDVYRRLQQLRQPSIAAINGLALGGGLELALACDLRIAARSAQLGVPEVKLGLLPAAGGSQRLARFLPPAIAKQMLLTGDPISAQTALDHGLVNEVVEDERVLDSALRLAGRLAEGPPLAMAAAKRLIDEGAPMDLETAILLERETISLLFATDDCTEGTRAFLEKRRPRFSGH